MDEESERYRGGTRWRKTRVIKLIGMLLRKDNWKCEGYKRKKSCVLCGYEIYLLMLVPEI